MQMFLKCSVIIIGFLVGLMMVYWVMVTRNKYSLFREKASPFECGFDPKNKARMPFSLRFFLIIMLFLMFDVELAMLLHLPYQFDYLFFKKRMIFIFFLAVLTVGTLEEWRRGLMNWM